MLRLIPFASTTSFADKRFPGWSEHRGTVEGKAVRQKEMALIGGAPSISGCSANLNSPSMSDRGSGFRCPSGKQLLLCWIRVSTAVVVCSSPNWACDAKVGNSTLFSLILPLSSAAHPDGRGNSLGYDLGR